MKSNKLKSVLLLKQLSLKMLNPVELLKRSTGLNTGESETIILSDTVK